MDDLISRAEAIDALRTHERKASHKWFDNQLDIEWNNAIDICCYDIEDLPSAQPEQQWIPCSEKDAEYPCLACDVFGQIFITDGGIVKINGECYDGTGFDFSNADEFLKGIKVGNAMRMLPRKIVAWLPLPEPYKEEEQDG